MKRGTMRRFIRFSGWFLVALLFSVTWQAATVSLLYIIPQDLWLPVDVAADILLRTILISTPILFISFILFAVVTRLSGYGKSSSGSMRQRLIILGSVTGFLLDLFLKAWLFWDGLSFYMDHPKYQSFLVGLMLKDWLLLVATSLSAALLGATVGYGYWRVYIRCDSNISET